MNELKRKNESVIPCGLDSSNYSNQASVSEPFLFSSKEVMISGRLPNARLKPETLLQIKFIEFHDLLLRDQLIAILVFFSIKSFINHSTSVPLRRPQLTIGLLPSEIKAEWFLLARSTVEHNVGYFQYM